MTTRKERSPNKGVHFKPPGRHITFFTEGRSPASIKRATNKSVEAKISKLGIKRNPNFL